MSEIIYEPRAFWSIAHIDTQLGAQRDGDAVFPSNRLLFGQNDFLNGEKYPVTLRYLCVDAPGYVWDTYTDGAALSQSNFRNDRVAVLDRARLSIAVMGRHYYNRDFMNAVQLGAIPTSEPRLDIDPDVAGVTHSNPRLFNVFRWAFDEDMILANDGAAEFWLSGIRIPGFAGLTAPVAADLPTATVAFHQGPLRGTSRGAGAFWSGSGRRATFDPLTSSNSPIPRDGFANSALVPLSTEAWPSTTRFNAQQFLAQAPNGFPGTVNIVKGFSVALDQTDWDAYLRGEAGVSAQGILASVGGYIGTRARNAQGRSGTQAWWWRPGAPLSLVSPTQTTARVYKLHSPITLAPGDSLRVQLEVPDAVSVPGVVGDVDSHYQLGVSLCGEAAIRG